MDLVSVVITTHNRKNCLIDAIESVRKQSYHNVEIIVVDDASNDGTEKLLRQQLYFEDIIFVRIDNSLGGNHARNLGLKIAKGKFIALLDDDDIWLKNKLEKEVNLLKSNDKLGLVYCGVSRFVDNDYEHGIPDKVIGGKRGDLSKYILLRRICLTSTILIKSDIITQEYFFDENVKYWQEYEWMIRIAQKWQIDFIPEHLVLYRTYSTQSKKESLTSKIDGWEESVQYIFNKHKALYETLSSTEIAERDALYYWEGYSRSKRAGEQRRKLHYLCCMLSKPRIFLFISKRILYKIMHFNE